MGDKRCGTCRHFLTAGGYSGECQYPLETVRQRVPDAIGIFRYGVVAASHPNCPCWAPRLAVVHSPEAA